MGNGVVSFASGAEGVAWVIAQMDRPTVYGIPGGDTAAVFNALRDRQGEVECILVREESLATVMAEAHGRLIGRPAVVMGQGAWFAGNAGIGILEAYTGCSPMVILVDATDGGSFSHHASYQGGMSSYGGYDLASVLRPITKRTFVALDPVQAVQMTQLAVKHATTGAPGPVAVVFHSRALWGALPEAPEAPSLYPSEGYWRREAMPPSPDSVMRCTELIAASERPVLVAGNGVRVSGAESALRSFAEGFDIPVAVTASGKGLLDEAHPLYLGVIGSIGHDRANTVVGAADLVIAVGTRLSSWETADEDPRLLQPTRQKIVQIDIEPLNVGWTTPVDLALVADAAVALDRLSAALKQGEGDGYTGNGAERRREATQQGEGIVFDDDAELRARMVPRMLSGLLPNDAIVACDAGENRLFMLADFVSGEGGVVLQPSGVGGMGYAIPAATAASLLFPDRVAVAVCGDGGFGMSIHGLMTAIESAARLIVVIMNNRALGWILHEANGSPFMATFRDFDLASIARAIGCEAATVTSAGELSSAVTGALTNSGVSVIVARTSLDDQWSDVTTRLARSTLQ